MKFFFLIWVSVVVRVFEFLLKNLFMMSFLRESWRKLSIGKLGIFLR